MQKHPNIQDKENTLTSAVTIIILWKRAKTPLPWADIMTDRQSKQGVGFTSDHLVLLRLH